LRFCDLGWDGPDWRGEAVKEVDAAVSKAEGKSDMASENRPGDVNEEDDDLLE
jgi:hypothetical protein